MIEKLKTFNGKKIKVTTKDNRVVVGFYNGWERSEENPDEFIVFIKIYDGCEEEMTENEIRDVELSSE